MSIKLPRNIYYEVEVTEAEQAALFCNLYANDQAEVLCRIADAFRANFGEAESAAGGLMQLQYIANSIFEPGNPPDPQIVDNLKWFLEELLCRLEPRPLHSALKNGDNVIGHWKTGALVRGVLVDSAMGKVRPHAQPTHLTSRTLAVYPDSIEQDYEDPGFGNVVDGE